MEWDKFNSVWGVKFSYLDEDEVLVLSPYTLYWMDSSQST